MPVLFIIFVALLSPDDIVIVHFFNRLISQPCIVCVIFIVRVMFFPRSRIQGSVPASSKAAGTRREIIPALIFRVRFISNSPWISTIADGSPVIGPSVGAQLHVVSLLRGRCLNFVFFHVSSLPEVLSISFNLRALTFATLWSQYHLTTEIFLFFEYFIPFDNLIQIHSVGYDDFWPH